MLCFYRGKFQPSSPGGYYYSSEIDLCRKPTSHERAALALELLLEKIEKWNLEFIELHCFLTKKGCLIKGTTNPDNYRVPNGFRLTLERKISKKRNLKLDLKTPPDLKTFLTHELPVIRKCAKAVIQNDGEV